MKLWKYSNKNIQPEIIVHTFYDRKPPAVVNFINNLKIYGQCLGRDSVYFKMFILSKI